MSEATEPVRVRCKRAECPVNKGGACMEDFENPEECSEAILPDSPEQESYRDVDRGDALSLESVATLHQEELLPTAALIGAPKSGKTTFLAMLFREFLASSKGFRGHRFMDSRTFLALNKRLHYADKRAKRQEVAMPRSSLEEEPAFHFKTKDETASVRECLWIDVPGDTLVHNLSKGVAGWEAFPGLARASHVVSFLDLEKIASPTLRGPHVEQCFDALAFSIRSETWRGRRLMVVFSKADQYLDEATDHLASLEARVKTRFEEDFEAIDSCRLYSLGKATDAKRSLGELWDWVHESRAAEFAATVGEE